MESCGFQSYRQIVYSIGLIINVKERKFQGTKVPPMELSFSGTKVLGYESSSYRSNDNTNNTRGCSSSAITPSLVIHGSDFRYID